MEYKDGKPSRVATVVLSHQHSDEVTYKELKEALIECVIKKAIPASLLDGKTMYHVNPYRRFVIGGPHGDTGLTGRKIIVDTYGGTAQHGGGAFSGKDPTKVDRSASYMARYVAKNIVATGLCDKCEVQIAYAIGIAKPVSLFVSTFGTGKVADEKIEKTVSEVFDLTPQGIITTLDLLRPIYRETAATATLAVKVSPGRRRTRWRPSRPSWGRMDDGGLTREAQWFQQRADGKVVCSLCPHGCVIAEDGHGICKVRYNRGGALALPFYGKLSALAVDPIEKKPLYHYHPGASILSAGFVGCSFHCKFCQNYHISQSTDVDTWSVTPAELVRKAKEAGSSGLPTHTPSL